MSDSHRSDVSKSFAASSDDETTALLAATEAGFAAEGADTDGDSPEFDDDAFGASFEIMEVAPVSVVLLSSVIGL